MIEWSKDRIWYQDMPWKRYGVPVGCRMTVIRLKNDNLLVHSPVQLTTDIQLRLAKLGHVSAIVTPNLNHHLFLSEWWLAYSQATFFAPPGLQFKRTDLVFDDALGAETPAMWRGQLLQTLLRGSDHVEEVVFCDPESQTLILGDAMAWLRNSHNPATVALAIANGCYFHPAMPLYWRHSFHNKTRLRQSLQEILTWPFDRILFAHGQVIPENGKHIFSQAFRWALA
ncbi:DUF4336 domain-containing protein [Photobacterium sp. WH77]|uniref:DUF4336 domain-containing protein n=1 Tax=Photobacterium TaxID=657 RepID=UPI001EDC8422|nr:MULTISPECIES: DUF4336 domain-containing protein [Photobacterium]MCG2838396.1 DUF4336 domain-containing protein [Photobacterium sp. WH77]MCG2846013.1 DUF4336 domain-containing protein [Photobacterium sp. WH80]